MSDALEQEMQNKIDTLAAENASLAEENATLKRQVAMLQEHVFGQKTEKRQVVREDAPDQLSLFNEAEVETKKNAEEPSITVGEHTRTKKKKSSREELLAALPHERELIDLPEDEKVCPDCGSELKPVGETYIRKEVILIPAKVKIVEYYQINYECRECRKEKAPKFIKPVMPQPVIPHSFASPSAVAHVMMQKYFYAVPLYRQEKEWQQLGISLSRANLANWIIISTQEWLSLIYDRMHDKLLKENYLHADETPVQVHKEKGRKNTSKSYMWLYASGQFEPRHAIRLFEYQPTRKGENAAAFLKGFTGYLHTDDFAGYGKLEIRQCLCMAHARRKFVDAIKGIADPQANSLSQEALDLIGALYAKEKEFKDLSPEERQIERQKQEKPLLEALFAWLEKNRDCVAIKSPISKAINYTLSNWEGLPRYLEDGHCSIDNNLAENSIRPFTVGRKNWLFSDSPKGAKASAMVYSIIETCKANQIDPEKYLIQVFTDFPNLDVRHHPEVVDGYMPWSTRMQELCK